MLDTFLKSFIRLKIFFYMFFLIFFQWCTTMNQGAVDDRERATKTPKSDANLRHGSYVVGPSSKLATIASLTHMTGLRYTQIHSDTLRCPSEHTIVSVHGIKCLNKRDVHVAQSAIAQTETINHKCTVSCIAFFCWSLKSSLSGLELHSTLPATLHFSGHCLNPAP